MAVQMPFYTSERPTLAHARSVNFVQENWLLGRDGAADSRPAKWT